MCRATSNAQFAGLAGADQNAMFLFQARDGSASYEGPRDGPQAQAADGYIARVIAGGAPPEQLRKVDYPTTSESVDAMKELVDENTR